MIERLFTADHGYDELLDVANALGGEMLLASAGTTGGGSGPGYLIRRIGASELVIELLEEVIGLRFTDDLTLPFCAALPRFVHDGGCLSGYVADYPELGPSQWVHDTQTRWAALLRDKNEWPGDGYILTERGRLVRCALWHCQTADGDATLAAVRFVAELTATGQAGNPWGAGEAIAALLQAGSESADSLVSAFYGDHTPRTAEDWIMPPLRYQSAASPLSRSAQRAIGWLVQHGWSLVERVRSAPDFDSWFAALAAVDSTSTAIVRALSVAMPDMPISLRAVHSQFEELRADTPPTLLAAMFGMTHAVNHMRSLARKFRAQGDTTGARFARERLLLPPALLEDHALPTVWERPTWRTANAWFPDADPGMKHRDASTIWATARPEIERLMSQEDPRCLDVTSRVVARLGWDDLAHRTHSYAALMADEIQEAIGSAVAAAALRPEDEANWKFLALVLQITDRAAAATAAQRVREAVNANRQRLADHRAFLTFFINPKRP
jgi:hypothetical protein